MQVSATLPVGAGLGIYRINDKRELEFLLVCDPFQRHSWRKGFEFPAGTIGDRGHRKVDQLNGAMIDQLPTLEKQRLPAKIFLRGAIREALEELVFIPAKKLINGHPYRSGRIDKKIELKAIDKVADCILQQRQLLCLRNVQGRSNYTIFFWDVSDLSPSTWLQQIQSQRATVLKKFFSSVSAIGAEPDAFAWVSAQELQVVIKKAQKESNINRIQGTYHITASELVQGNKLLQRNAVIKLSPGFVGLISRLDQQQSSQNSVKILNMSNIIMNLQKNV